MSPSTDSRENREFASEIKFLIPSAVAAQIQGWARAGLSPDPHAGGEHGDGYVITSLYFDTADFAVFHRRGSYGRSKYRIRRYGGSEVVFLERKLKTRGLLTKRRSMVPANELGRLACEPEASRWPGRWFQRRLLVRDLKPVCQISYRRIARVAMTDHGPIRLTLDDALHAMPASETRFSRGAGTLILEDRMILEMKFRHALPAQFKYLIEEFALTPGPFSKYRRAATFLGLAASREAEAQTNSIPEYA